MYIHCTVYTPNCIRFTCAMTLRGSCEHSYKDFSDLFFLLESYDIALSISIWHMYLGVSGVRWPLAKAHLHVIMGNLHFKKSRRQVTADDPKLFFQMLDIYSGNIIFEGYWKNSSSCEDMDPWSSRVNSQSSHFGKSRFRQGSDDPWQPEVHRSGMCHILIDRAIS